MSERGDLLELVCDAFGRLPRLSATVRSWTHLGRQEQAMDEARRLGSGGPFPLLLSIPGTEPPSEFESTERLVIDPRRGAFRVEHEDSFNRSQFFISDGETLWTPNFRGDVLAVSSGRRHLRSQAAQLLDPSWLVGYEWSTPSSERHNGREVLRLRAQTSARTVTRMPSGVQATDVEVLIDAQLGFLHQITEYVNGDPYRVVELRELVLDPTLEPDLFRVDDSVPVIDETEWIERQRPTWPKRLWWRLRSLAWRSHQPAWLRSAKRKRRLR